ncbi:NAD(P)/FAD-dependent oxidoreductase [Salirhabdus salicampi]|uniref:NAD(P)/FAD-dependent oxidoreductase n=1 Tax=Salirhabdus salicampi TaxID=476102 RepID=UPI0020C554E1|nr:NAD(P)/FAD-dependent oxidoreductase [Salirhabdus salicampi]
MIFDCIIIGGGIAGLQASIQLGRYNHHILVIDAGKGRSALCRSYHNILGWPDGISGEKLRKIGREQAKRVGVQFHDDQVVHVQHIDEKYFQLETKNGFTYKGKRLLFATGLLDRLPNIPHLEAFLGLSVYVCPDCDGYEVNNKKTIVIGSGDVGANMALTLTYWTNDLMYINHEQTNISNEKYDQLKRKGIPIINQSIMEITGDGPSFQGVILADGQPIDGERGFIAMGGNQVKSSLAKSLGVQPLKNDHIEVNPRTRETNVKHVWAAGDVVAHSELVTLAMGEGSQAAIWIHKSLL